MEDDWAKIDVAQFIDVNDFDDMVPVSSMLPDDTLYLRRDETFKQSEKKRNDSQSLR